jgi:hypothetical protein
LQSASHLLDLDHDELGGGRGRPGRSGPGLMIRRRQLSHDQVGVLRGHAWNALPEQTHHERADVEPHLRPRLVVGLEHDPLRAAVQSLEEQRKPLQQVLVFVGALVGAA